MKLPLNVSFTLQTSLLISINQSYQSTCCSFLDCEFTNKMRLSDSFKTVACSLLTLTTTLLPVYNRLSLESNTSGCGIVHKPDANGESTLVTFKEESCLGQYRQYRIHLPPNYDANVSTPVIFSYHGGFRNMLDQQKSSQFSNNTINPDMIAVYPQGCKVSINSLIKPFLSLHSKMSYAILILNLQRIIGRENTLPSP